jgi:hypothetical protein
MSYRGGGKLIEVNSVREVVVDAAARTFEIATIDKYHDPSCH